MGHRLKDKIFKTVTAAGVMIALAVTAPAALAARELVPMGNAVGISMMTDGVIVVGISEIETENGPVSPAKDVGITGGDIITGIAGRNISSSGDLADALGMLDGKNPVPIQLKRGAENIQLEITPYKPADGPCELGLWLRDGMTGIGTMTFYDPQTHMFGALGHSITDGESGVVLPLRDGSIMRASVTDVVPGQAGTPGQLVGSFSENGQIGTLSDNCRFGVFGKMNECDLTEKKALPVASESEICTGKASILTNIFGNSVNEYEVEITRVYGGDNEERSMMLHVTDPDLISKTGGIVQGMSGSPIIQNGKIIGAVTHVLIGNPEKGYGISAEKMLSRAESLVKAPAA